MTHSYFVLFIYQSDEMKEDTFAGREYLLCMAEMKKDCKILVENLKGIKHLPSYFFYPLSAPPPPTHTHTSLGNLLLRQVS
jgi:hypothetical protein